MHTLDVDIHLLNQNEEARAHRRQTEDGHKKNPTTTITTRREENRHFL